MKLSHAEAQALISARLDGPLDPVAERELNAHLATCASCRAFNASAGTLARGLQNLPYLPASPAVTRAVLDHVSAPRSPWTWFPASLPANVLPAATAIAAAVIVVFVGSFAAFRLLDTEEEPSTLPASTLTETDLAQGITQTGAATEAAATEAAGQMDAQSAATEASAAPSERNPTRSETETPSASDASLPAQATEEIAEIGPPPASETGTSNAAQAAPATDAPAAVPTDAPTPTLEPTSTPPPTLSASIRQALGLEPAEPTGTAGEATAAPTATEEPTPELTPTVEPTPEPTAAPTDAPTPEPTPTTAPTETVAPTETPAPTATPDPTETPAPTATVVPTETLVPTELPIVEPPAEPTATPATEPTPVPTEVPTATPTEPPTPLPTDVPTEEPTPTVVPIELIGETPDDESGSDDEGDDSANEPTPSDDPAIIDSGDPDDTVDATPGSESIIQDLGEDGPDQVIEPSGGDDDGEEPADNSGQGGQGQDDEDSGTGSDNSLAGTDVYALIDGIPGDPTTRLGLDADGSLIFSPQPGRASLEQDGITLDTSAGSSGQTVAACDGNGSCADITSAPASGGNHTDTPLGWLDGRAIYERLDGEFYPVEFRAVTIDPDTLQPLSDNLLGGGEAGQSVLIRPYAVGGTLLVPSAESWLRITASEVQVIAPNPAGGNLDLIRIDPTSGTLSYVTDGTLVVAPLEAPGSPDTQLPFAGIDYAIAPDGSLVAVSTGNAVNFLDSAGNVVATIASDGGEVGSLYWIDEGLIVVDYGTGTLKILNP